MALLLNKHNTYFLVIIFEILIHQQCDKWCNKVVTHTKQRDRDTYKAKRERERERERHEENVQNITHSIIQVWNNT